MTFRWKQIDNYYEILYRNVYVTIEPRPHYCDRGRWVAKITAPDLWLDDGDGWPRYYFDIGRAKLEIEAFLEMRAGRKERP